jgi:hypothetical protein
MHILKFVQKGIDALSILNKIEHQAFSWIWHERVINITDPEDSWVCIRITCEVIKLDTLVVCDDAEFSCVWVWKVIEALLNCRQSAGEETIVNSSATYINAKHESICCYWSLILS